MASRARSESGQAAVSFVAVVPLALLCALLCAQLAVAGHALLSAGNAARAAARAIEVGEPPRPVARRALLPSLRDRAEVGRDGAVARVRVLVPALLPGLPRHRVAASAALDPAAGGE
jgi:pilus assembly protein CpaE